MTDRIFSQIVAKEKELMSSGRAMLITGVTVSSRCYYELSRGGSPLVSQDRIFEYPMEISRSQEEDIIFEIYDPWEGFDLRTPEGRRASVVHQVSKDIEEGRLISPHFRQRMIFDYMDESPTDIRRSQYLSTFKKSQVVAEWDGLQWQIK